MKKVLLPQGLTAKVSLKVSIQFMVNLKQAQSYKQERK